jgi:hypothetical protein
LSPKQLRSHSAINRLTLRVEDPEVNRELDQVRNNQYNRLLVPSLFLVLVKFIIVVILFLSFKDSDNNLSSVIDTLI